MRAEDLYHTGIVVEDLDATLRSLPEVAGYEWCDEFVGEQVVLTPAGEVNLPLRFAYSTTEPRLEILQGSGLAVEARAPLPDGTTLWAYCRPADGPRAELVSRLIEPTMREWFATGKSPLS